MSDNLSLQTTHREKQGDELAPELGSLTRMSPAVDIFENDEGYVIRADVPGATEDSIDVRFDRGELVFEARRPYTAEGSRIAHEFGAVLYRRAFRIPEAVAADGIDARLSQGVLELRLPKAEEVRPRQIRVHA
jgi:HSP20 family protein